MASGSPPSLDAKRNRQGESFSKILRIQREREIPADLLPSLGRLALKEKKEKRFGKGWGVHDQTSNSNLNLFEKVLKTYQR
jgi:hypothetical protein